MKKDKKRFINFALIAIFLLFYSFYSYNVLGFFKIINNNKIKSVASQATEVNPDNVDITKNNQDLLNVDYTKYYDDLKPYGTWIKVNLSDYAPNKNKQKGKTEISDVLRNLLGVSDAKADMDFGWGIFYVWKPFPTLAVNIVAGEPSPGYIPYTNGQWVYSDYGWYFRGATYQEEIVHHYGRWIFVPDEGWIWVPGSRWAPSWVDWEEDDDYISWTPSTPCFYHDNEYYTVPYYWQNNCVVVEKRHFLDPYVYRYSREYRRHEDRHEFRDMKRIHGLDFRDRMVYNDGPDFKNIEKNYGRRINPVNINMVSNREDVRYNKKQFDVYSYAAGNKNVQMNNKSDIFQKFSGNKFNTNENFGLKNKESGKNNSSFANNKNRDNTSLNRNQDNSKSKDNSANNLRQKQDKGNNNNTLSNKLNSRENIKGNIKSNNKSNNNVNIGNNNNNRKKDITSSKNPDNGYNNNSRNKVKNNEQVKSNNNSGKRNNISNQTKVNENKINSGNKTNNNYRGNVVNKSQKKDNSSNLNQYKGNDVKQNNKNGNINKNNAGNNTGKRQYVDDTKMSPHNKNNYVPQNKNTGNNTSTEKNNGKRNKK